MNRFDPDQPHPRDKSHIRLSYVTHFYFNQQDASAVMDLLRRYEAYRADLLDRIQFVIVDDGSPVAYEIPDFDLNITWLKITDAIDWNQGGSRNLGVLYAKSDKVLTVDLDHEFPEATLAYMARMKECGRNMYRIYRTDPDTGQRIKKHPNTFLMSRARFMRLFGYDEEFAGHYGSEDYRFVKLHKYHGTRFVYLNKKYTCFHRQDIDRDRSYHSLERDLSFNTPIDLRKKRETLTYGKDAGYSRIFLNFNWKILKDHSRKTRAARQPDRLWKHIWYWRWLFGDR